MVGHEQHVPKVPDWSWWTWPELSASVQTTQSDQTAGVMATWNRNPACLAMSPASTSTPSSIAWPRLWVEMTSPKCSVTGSVLVGECTMFLLLG
jgi:hypothetical protein